MTLKFHVAKMLRDKMLVILRASVVIAGRVGALRSLVAYLHGVQVVGGSNPLAPTKEFERVSRCWPFFISARRT